MISSNSPEMDTWTVHAECTETGQMAHASGHKCIVNCSADYRNSLQASLRGSHERRLLGSAFSAWQQHTESKRQLAAIGACITAWRAHRRLRAIFCAWASLAQREQQDQVDRSCSCLA